MSREWAGQRIAGSRFFREYCARCHEPMRVTQDLVGTKPMCEQCDPKPPPPPLSSGKNHNDPCLDNGVRALEGD